MLFTTSHRDVVMSIISNNYGAIASALTRTMIAVRNTPMEFYIAARKQLEETLGERRNDLTIHDMNISKPLCVKDGITAFVTPRTLNTPSPDEFVSVSLPIQGMDKEPISILLMADKDNEDIKALRKQSMMVSYTYALDRAISHATRLAQLNSGDVGALKRNLERVVEIYNGLPDDCRSDHDTANLKRIAEKLELDVQPK